VTAVTHREAQLLELFGAERASSLVAQAVLTLVLERCLAQIVKRISLVLQGERQIKHGCVVTVMQALSLWCV